MNFVIGKGRATELYEAVERLGIKARFKKNLLLLTYAQLEELARRGFAVKFLNDTEKDTMREVKAVTPAPDPDAFRRVLEEIAKMVRIIVTTSHGRLYIRIITYDRSKLEEIATVEIRATILRKK